METVDDGDHQDELQLVEVRKFTRSILEDQDVTVLKLRECSASVHNPVLNRALLEEQQTVISHWNSMIETIARQAQPQAQPRGRHRHQEHQHQPQPQLPSPPDVFRAFRFPRLERKLDSMSVLENTTKSSNSIFTNDLVDSGFTEEVGEGIGRFEQC